MNHAPLPTVLAVLVSLAGNLPAQEKKTATAPAPEKKEAAKTEAKPTPEPPAKIILESAIKNMATLKSYHVEAELDTKAGKATLKGDLGPGTLHFFGQDPQGVRKQRIVANQTFFLSTDEGKTWKTGEEADQDGTIFLSQVITGPVSPEIKIWTRGRFQAKEEKVGGETLLRIEKPASGKEPASIFWVSKEAGFADAFFVRKSTLTIDSEAGEFPVTVTYTKFNEPVEIKAPETAAPAK